MSEYGKYYTERLYPLQNGILRTLAPVCGSSLFLTGGTALSRVYLQHRYSDDIDLFANAHPEFGSIVEHALSALDSAGYQFVKGSLIRTEAFSQVVVNTNNVTLNIDFVNDVAPHFGGFLDHDIYPRVDSIRNILSNKLTALYRLEAKDVADLHAIASVYSFNWGTMLEEAEEKEGGLDAGTIAELIAGFPRELFNSIKWIMPPPEEQFYADLKTLALDIVRSAANSLAVSGIMIDRAE